MGTPKQKAVFSADPQVLEQVKELVDDGQYSSLSHFIREAMAEKLRGLRQRHLREAVARYCAAGHAGEDEELVRAQELDDDEEGSAEDASGRRRAE